MKDGTMADFCEMSRAVQPLVDQGGLAGAVMLAGDRKGVVGVEAVGYADIAARREMATDTMFWIASQTKPMTASALMMLVDEGKLALDDPLEKHLPELKGLWVTAEQDEQHMLLRRPSRAVTVRDVLRHTSGFPQRTLLEEPTRDQFALADLIRSYAITPLEYQPGTRYLYSNVGLAVAGRIIEVVSGMPYATFLQDRLFDPLGMGETTFWPSEAQVARLATSYKPAADGAKLESAPLEHLRSPLSDRTRHPMPGGGLFATARDVERFCRMFLGGGVFEGRRLLSAAAVAEMTRRQTPANLTESYGLGWQVDSEFFGHGGAYGTHMAVDVGRGLTLIYLVQHRGYLGDGGTGRQKFHQAARELHDRVTA